DHNATDVTLSHALIGTDLLVKVNDTGETITVSQHFRDIGPSQNMAIEQIQFADGTTWGVDEIRANAWYRGTPNADVIQGSAFDETIVGGAGADRMTGGGGNDTFVFQAGFGNDTITDFAPGDVIAFDHDVFADFAAVQAAATSQGADTVITVDAATTLTLQNVALASL